jgi:hypothetical protein
MNKSAREVARSLHRYFDDALDFHGNGQETRLFPALLAQVHDADALPVLVTTLKNERALENAWATLRASLLAVALCRPAKLSIDDATGFAAMYQHHIVNETRQLLALGSSASHLAKWVSIAPSHPRGAAYRSQFGGDAPHSDRW